jgi:hypothetical protein
MAGSPIEQYTSLLNTRKRWAKIGSVALGICALILLIAALGFLWVKRTQPVTGTSVLIVLVLCFYPLLGLVSQIVEHRWASVLLELLDVLERESRVQEPDGQQAET